MSFIPTRKIRTRSGQRFFFRPTAGRYVAVFIYICLNWLYNTYFMRFFNYEKKSFGNWNFDQIILNKRKCLNEKCELPSGMRIFQKLLSHGIISVVWWEHPYLIFQDRLTVSKNALATISKGQLQLRHLPHDNSKVISELDL